MDVKKKIIITGQKVHDIGYRPFLLGIAESLGIESFFADNTFVNKKQAVYALVDSSEEKVEAFVEIASSKFPEKSDVEKVDVEGYSGNVMKIESYYRYLTAMQLSKIAAYGGKMLEKQDLQLEITERGFGEMQKGFAEVKDEMRKGFGEVKEELAKGFADMRQGFGEVKEELAKGFGDMRQGSAEVREEVHLMRDDFREVFMHEVGELRSEIADIKATLARMQAAG